MEGWVNSYLVGPKGGGHSNCVSAGMDAEQTCSNHIFTDGGTPLAPCCTLAFSARLPCGLIVCVARCVAFSVVKIAMPQRGGGHLQPFPELAGWMPFISFFVIPS